MNCKLFNKTIKQTLALLLAAAMVATSFSVPVKAEEEGPVVEIITEDVVEDTASEEVAETPEELPEVVVEEDISADETDASDDGIEVITEVNDDEAEPEIIEGEVVDADEQIDIPVDHKGTFRREEDQLILGYDSNPKSPTYHVSPNDPVVVSITKADRDEMYKDLQEEIKDKGLYIWTLKDGKVAEAPEVVSANAVSFVKLDEKEMTTAEEKMYILSITSIGGQSVIGSTDDETKTNIENALAAIKVPEKTGVLANIDVDVYDVDSNYVLNESTKKTQQLSALIKVENVAESLQIKFKAGNKALTWDRGNTDSKSVADFITKLKTVSLNGGSFTVSRNDTEKIGHLIGSEPNATDIRNDNIYYVKIKTVNGVDVQKTENNKKVPDDEAIVRELNNITTINGNVKVEFEIRTYGLNEDGVPEDQGDGQSCTGSVYVNAKFNTESTGDEISFKTRIDSISAEIEKDNNNGTANKLFEFLTREDDPDNSWTQIFVKESDKNGKIIAEGHLTASVNAIVSSNTCNYYVPQIFSVNGKPCADTASANEALNKIYGHGGETAVVMVTVDKWYNNGSNVTSSGNTIIKPLVRVNVTIKPEVGQLMTEESISTPEVSVQSNTSNGTTMQNDLMKELFSDTTDKAAKLRIQEYVVADEDIKENHWDPQSYLPSVKTGNGTNYNYKFILTSIKNGKTGDKKVDLNSEALDTDEKIKSVLQGLEPGDYTVTGIVDHKVDTIEYSNANPGYATKVEFIMHILPNEGYISYGDVTGYTEVVRNIDTNKYEMAIKKAVKTANPAITLYVKNDDEDIVALSNATIVTSIDEILELGGGGSYYLVNLDKISTNSSNAVTDISAGNFNSFTEGDGSEASIGTSGKYATLTYSVVVYKDVPDDIKTNADVDVCKFNIDSAYSSVVGKIRIKILPQDGKIAAINKVKSEKFLYHAVQIDNELIDPKKDYPDNIDHSAFKALVENITANLKIHAFKDGKLTTVPTSNIKYYDIKLADEGVDDPVEPNEVYYVWNFSSYNGHDITDTSLDDQMQGVERWLVSPGAWIDSDKMHNIHVSVQAKEFVKPDDALTDPTSAENLADAFNTVTGNNNEVGRAVLYYPYKFVTPNPYKNPDEYVLTFKSGVTKAEIINELNKRVSVKSYTGYKMSNPDANDPYNAEYEGIYNGKASYGFEAINASESGFEKYNVKTATGEFKNKLTKNDTYYEIEVTETPSTVNFDATNKVYKAKAGGVWKLGIEAYVGNENDDPAGTTQILGWTANPFTINVYDAGMISNVKLTDKYYGVAYDSANMMKRLAEKIHDNIAIYTMGEDGKEQLVDSKQVYSEADLAEKALEAGKYDLPAGDIYTWKIDSLSPTGALKIKDKPEKRTYKLTVTKRAVKEDGTLDAVSSTKIREKLEVWITGIDGTVVPDPIHGLTGYFGYQIDTKDLYVDDEPFIVINKMAPAKMLESINASIAKQSAKVFIDGEVVVVPMISMAEFKNIDPQTLEEGKLYYVYDIKTIAGSKYPSTVELEKMKPGIMENYSDCKDITFDIYTYKKPASATATKATEVYKTSKPVSIGLMVSKADYYHVRLYVLDSKDYDLSRFDEENGYYLDSEKYYKYVDEGQVEAGRVIGEIPTEFDSYGIKTWYNAKTNKAWSLTMDPVYEDMAVYGFAADASMVVTGATLKGKNGDVTYSASVTYPTYTGKVVAPTITVEKTVTNDTSSVTTTLGKKSYSVKYYKAGSKKKAVKPKAAGDYTAVISIKKNSKEKIKAQKLTIDFKVNKKSLNPYGDSDWSWYYRDNNKSIDLKKNGATLPLMKTLKLDGITAKLGTDYTYTVRDCDDDWNIIYTGDTGAKAAKLDKKGSYKVVVKATDGGNFEGKGYFVVYVSDAAKNVANAKISKIKPITLNAGTTSNLPRFTFRTKDGKSWTVDRDKYGDYDVYSSTGELCDTLVIDHVSGYNDVAGTVKLKIRGTADIYNPDSYYGEKVFSYKIKKDAKKTLKKSMLTSTVKGFKKVEYDGREWTLYDYLTEGAYTDAEYAAYVETLETALKSDAVFGRDYTIGYEKNINPGKAAIIFKAIPGSGWSGSFKYNFTINKASVKNLVKTDNEGNTTGRMYQNDLGEYSESNTNFKAGKKSKVTLTDAGLNGMLTDLGMAEWSRTTNSKRGGYVATTHDLVKGTDFTAKVKAAKLGKKVKVTVKGKGNYTGKYSFYVDTQSAE